MLRFVGECLISAANRRAAAIASMQLFVSELVSPGGFAVTTPLARAAAFALALSLAACGFFSLLSLQANAATGCLVSASTYVAGQHPYWVTLADLNHDGILDAIVANPPQNGVSVMLGRGDGTFASPRFFISGFQPEYVTAADLNGDGNLDLVVSEYDYCVPSEIDVLLGNGDGTFQIAQGYTVDKTPLSIAVADFNGDAIPDLAVANTCSNDISILFGVGDGTFLLPVNYTILQPRSVVAADVNHDGHIDLAVADADANVDLLINRGDGTFQNGDTVSLGLGALPLEIKAADFNHDGNVDFAISNNFGGTLGTGSISIVLGNADGTLQTPASYDSPFTSEGLAVADLDNDGNLDLAAGTMNSDGINAFFGDGNGNFQPWAQFTSGDATLSVAAGDLNGDGFADLVAANNGVGTTFNGNLSLGSVAVFLNRGSSRDLVASRNYAAGIKPTAIAAADFNGDGFPDLAVAHFDGELGTMLARGDGTFSPLAGFHGGSSLTAVAAADFNHDGRIDLAVTSLAPDSLRVFLGNGDGTFQDGVIYQSGVRPRSIAVGDFNSDGQLDLAIANEITGTPGTVSILLGNGDGSFQTPMAVGAGMRPKAVVAADFNHDGILDLAVANFISNNVSILLGRGDGTFQAAVDYLAGQRPRSIAAADLNHDGAIDLAVADSATSKISVLFGNGDGTFQKAVRVEAGPHPNFVAIADMNHDGLPDLVETLAYTATMGNGSMGILLGNGDGTFRSPLYYPTGDLPRSAALADYNGDGFIDAATANFSGFNVTVLLNASSAPPVKNHPPGTPNRP
jgi:hypothetical protein